ncbi:MAG: energy transducer TonB [Acidobacteria bacterium]|nr:energy transducer TonB [Acidobacteriota bacterium]
MSAQQTRQSFDEMAAPGHLRLRLDQGRAVEVRFQFEEPERRRVSAVGASIIGHAAFIGLWAVILWVVPDPIREAILPDSLPRQIVWLAEPGPGGGGGGGNQRPEPPKPAELPGKQEISVPTPKPEPVPEPPNPEEAPIEQLTIPAQTMAAAQEASVGVLESGDVSSQSTGSGRGTGAGSGQGSGLGQGSGGGTGGGVYRPGSGVVNPRLVREVKPQYTADAMRAKIQGTVLLECIILPDGSVGRVDVVKSLDPTFGLDAEAVKAAKQWRFVPGTRFGEPVAVLVTIELTFTLR